LNVLDQWGRTVLVSEVQDQEVLDLETLPPGNYFFRFSDGRKSYFRMVSLVGK
ncbi:MAG TPA: T9SS type A sorting domain-containing protein, partial [Saprospiraceae bacterium]|nr:T9SS type A sorting domain-containing protein [Saprospiraceae bacterium]